MRGKAIEIFCARIDNECGQLYCTGIVKVDNVALCLRRKKITRSWGNR